jgi:MFS transporter, DHA1 family, inner membrane transport protein
VDREHRVVEVRAEPAAKARHVVVAITALALGGFAIGTTEFVTMGLLPEIARGIGESIPRTGHIISAYAAGVVVGAPVIVSLGARLPRRELAVGLVLALALGNAFTALAHGRSVPRRASARRLLRGGVADRGLDGAA